jgi:hypothetical protein
MLRISETLSGPSTLDGAYEISNCTGSLTAARGAHLCVRGVVVGDLRVNEGAELELFGLVFGSVYSRGVVRVRDTAEIRGALVCGRAARVEVSEGAQIRRGRRAMIEVAA